MKKTIKKYNIESEKVNIKLLSGMDIDLKTKRKLQRQAKNWLRYIELHSKEAHSDKDDDNMYHKGEMNFIKTFFFDKVKKQRSK